MILLLLFKTKISLKVQELDSWTIQSLEMDLSSPITLATIAFLNPASSAEKFGLMIRYEKNFWEAIIAKRWEIDQWLLLDTNRTNRKSYMGS